MGCLSFKIYQHNIIFYVIKIAKRNDSVGAGHCGVLVYSIFF